MTSRVHHLIAIRQQRLAMAPSRIIVSEIQRPLVDRIDDILDILEATSAALLDNAFDHAEHIDQSLVIGWTQRLANIQSNLDHAALLPHFPEPSDCAD